MKLKQIRYSHSPDSTGSLLNLDGDFFGYICEDEKREIKVPGETRIPAGTYKIELRNAGGVNKRYHELFVFHRGMLHLQNVPGFEWIYIHIGNTEKHTAGCLLVGYGAWLVNGENQVINSTQAYSDLYKMILAAMDMGEDIFIQIKDM